ncbi:hypothetical protein QIO51_gp4 [ssRNA phage SRR6960802_3]|uniref:Uncharacterized protein n=1 Tax=ssRNA phage SRR6960802_3 TaxID=2786609 RepID=A0A8S5L0T9_9VIRU|nr:hypothetical protein QIO51_gp4 [ssRNA phage SRR6960802_3]DAD51052.1 TPA_asm: hypothetical protein [ssRNA phage SRR6960802_3]
MAEEPRRAMELDTTPRYALYLLALIGSMGFGFVLLAIVFALGILF